MKFEMIIQDDLFTFKPLDNAAVAWIRKSPWATRSGGDSGEHAGPTTTLGTHETSVSRRRCISPGHWRQSAGRHSDRAE